MGITIPESRYEAQSPKDLEELKGLGCEDFKENMGITLPHSLTESQLFEDFLKLKGRKIVDPILSFPIIVNIPLRDFFITEEARSKCVTMDASLRVCYQKDYVDISLVPPDGIKYARFLFSKYLSGQTTLKDITLKALEFLGEPSPESSKEPSPESSKEWSPVENEKQTTPKGQGQVDSGGKEEKITHSRLEFDFFPKDFIGRGSFSEVYKVKSKIDKMEYAVKVVQKSDAAPTLKDLYREAKYLARSKHENVVSYCDAWTDKESTLCISMEWCPCNLESWLRENTENVDVDGIFRQLAAGLAHIHSLGIIHQDLAPSNIFMVNGVPKIGDFGIALKLKEGQSSIPWRDWGQPRYKAPEMENKGVKGPVTQKIDIFSLGLIIFELMYPLFSKDELKDIFKKIRAGNLPSYIVTNASENANLLISMLDIDPDKRPTAKSIVSRLGYGYAKFC